MRKIQILWTTMFLSMFVSSHTFAASANIIKGGVMLNPIGSGATIHYEKMLNRAISIGGRGNIFNYTYEDGDYTEDGSGVGADASFRYYPSQKGPSGYFLGANLGLANVNWDYTEYRWSGSGSSLATNIAFVTGWKIPMGKGFFEPSFALGTFFSFITASSDNEDESELGAYILAGFEYGGFF